MQPDLNMLRWIDENLGRISDDVRDLKGRVTSREESFANLLHGIRALLSSRR
jgi:hypothetical protein